MDPKNGISGIDPKYATGTIKALFERIWNERGMVPALQRVMAQSPSVLQGYLALQEHLDSGVLEKQLRYQIALAVSQANRSEYCVAAYCALGKAAGLSDEALRDARAANSPDRRTDTALKFARALEIQTDQAAKHLLPSLRKVSFSDTEIVEIVAQVMLVRLTNALYLMSDIETDFPPINN